MRLFLRLFAGLCGLAVLAAAGLAAFLLTADLRPLIERWAAKETGRAVGIGSLQIAWGRRIGIEARQVTLANAAWSDTPQMIEVGSLSAVADLWSLLRGTPRYERVAIRALSVVLERGPGHVGNWKMGDGGGGGGLVPKTRAQFPTLIDFVLADGQVIYRDAEAGLDLAIDLAEVVIAATADDTPVSLTWRGAYNKTPLLLEAKTQSFVILRRPEIPFGTALKLTVAGSSITLDGSMMEPLDFEGVEADLRADVPDLAALLNIFGAGFDVPRRAHLSSRFSHAGDRWLLADSRGDIAGSAFRGNIDFREAPRGKPDALGLALQFDRLDLDTLFPSSEPRQSFRDTPLDIGSVRKTDVSGHVTAASTAFGGVEGTDLEIVGHRTGGEIAIAKLGVRMLGGTLQASGSAHSQGAGARLLVTGDVAGLKLEDMARRLGTDTAGVNGRITGHLALESAGRTAGDALSALRGSAVLVLNEGRIPRALLAKASTDLKAMFRDAAGSAEIGCFLAILAIRDGVGRLAPARLRTAETTVNAVGSLDFGHDKMDVVISTQQSGSRFLVLNVPLRLRGPFADIGMSPLAGDVPAPEAADLAALPFAGRGLAEYNTCLR